MRWPCKQQISNPDLGDVHTNFGISTFLCFRVRSPTDRQTDRQTRCIMRSIRQYFVTLSVIKPIIYLKNYHVKIVTIHKIQSKMLIKADEMYLLNKTILLCWGKSMTHVLLRTHNKRIRSADAVKSVIEGFKLSIDSTVQQIVDIFLNIFYNTVPTLIKSSSVTAKWLKIVKVGQMRLWHNKVQTVKTHALKSSDC